MNGWPFALRVITIAIVLAGGIVGGGMAWGGMKERVANLEITQERMKDEIHDIWLLLIKE